MGDIMKIEKYKKLKDNKYRIFLDNGTIIDSYEDVIIKNNLLYKKDLDLDLIQEIEKENEYQKAYDMALKYISIRLRSIYEIKIYLKKKNINSNIIDITIERLKKNNFLNDDIFTNAFIRDKLNFTTMGKFKLINELNNLKINNEIIEKYIDEIDDDFWCDRIDKLINKYLKNQKKNDGYVLKNKLYNYLVNLGYDKHLVINCIDKLSF